MKTATKIENKARRAGYRITVGRAQVWGLSKKWAFCVYDTGFGAWFEPTTSFYSLRELNDAVDCLIREN